jgi:hypothetical protein
LSSQVLQATVNSAYLTTFPVTWTLSVINPAPPNNPSQAPATATFNVTDPSQPAIMSIVNAASYLPRSVFTGTGKDPTTAAGLPTYVVSPREIISIFGANLSSSGISTATATATPPSTTLVYPSQWDKVQVIFQIGSGPTATTVNAPILMTSSNQINAIVPVEVASVIGTASPTVSVQVNNNGAPTPPFPPGFDAKPAPFGVAFTGMACSEPRLIELAFAFERATRRRMPPPSAP